jgi:probable rRNA maturation factor
MKNMVGEGAMAARPPSRRLNLSVQYASGETDMPTRSLLRRFARASLVGGGSVTLRLVDAEEGRQLNRDFRGRDYATNVLSFSYAPPPLLAGDLVLCVPVVRQEAAQQAKTLEAHFAHLVVHGMLHLQGFDHENENDAEKMESAEQKILAGLGYPDPYAPTLPLSL